MFWTKDEETNRRKVFPGSLSTLMFLVKVKCVRPAKQTILGINLLVQAMSDVKQINASEAFLGLDEKTKGCQNEVTLEDCWMQKFLKGGMDGCKCIPYSFKNYSNQEVI